MKTRKPSIKPTLKTYLIKPEKSKKKKIQYNTKNIMKTKYKSHKKNFTFGKQ